MKKRIWILNQIANSVKRFAMYLYGYSCLFLAFSILIRRKIIQYQKKTPSVMQLYNNLIEFYDPPHLLEAAKAMDRLIAMGVSPEHAFRMVVQ